MKKIVSLLAIMTFLPACAEPPPEHPTAKQWCNQVRDYECTEEQGFESFDDCVEFMGVAESLSKESGCSEEWDEWAQCAWYLDSLCNTECAWEMDRMTECW